MNQVAKKGDLALVQFARGHVGPLPGGSSGRNGQIVSVMTDSARHPSPPTLPFAVQEKPFNYCSFSDGVKAYIATYCLIPIRDPDADITRTTEREVAA